MFNIHLISSAYADAAMPAAAGNNSFMSLILMLVVFFVISYFLLWRPQSKRAKEHRDLLSNLSKGDEVVTTGGVLGKINKIDDNFIMIMVAPNVEITMQKSAIAAVLPKGTLKTL